MSLATPEVGGPLSVERSVDPAVHRDSDPNADAEATVIAINDAQHRAAEQRVAAERLLEQARLVEQQIAEQARLANEDRARMNRLSADLELARANEHEAALLADKLAGEHAEVDARRAEVEAHLHELNRATREARAKVDAARKELTDWRGMRETIEVKLNAEHAALKPTFQAIEELRHLESKLALTSEAARRVAERRAADAARRSARMA